MANPDSDSCPSVERLEAHLGGGDDASLAGHLDSCAACRARLEELAENNALLGRLRAVQAKPGPEADSSHAPMARVADYEIIRELHRGGQGIVYEAHHPATNRAVAIKVLVAGAFATDVQRRRFEREVELAAALRHPNIVTVYDSGTTGDGRHWLAMELIEGVPLDEFVRRRFEGDPGAAPLTLPHLLRLVITVAEAVGHAHRHGVIHRDLKPSNILVDDAGEPHVVDFGLARSAAPPASAVTETGGFVGTLAYASPEQLGGDPNRVDVRSDVYSLGVILYQLLSGRFPYPVEGRLSEILAAIEHAAPAPLSSRRPDRLRIAPDLRTIVEVALAKEPERRYQSAAALGADLERFLDGRPIDARRDSGWYVLGKTISRHRVAAAGAALVLVLLVVFGVAMTLLYNRAVRETEKLAKVNLFLEDTLGSVEPGPGETEPSLRAMLDEGMHWIGLVLGDDPEVEAAVQVIIGQGYRNIARFDDAEALLESARRTHVRLHGERSLEVARSLSGLGHLRLAQGRPGDAKTLFLDALAIRGEHRASDDPLIALSLGNLARAHRDLGELDAAEAAVRRALAIRIDRFGPDHADTAMSRFTLAGLLETQGRIDEALELHRAALAARRRAVHELHPDVARSLMALGRLHLDRGEPAEAEPLLRECVELRRRGLPEGHPGVAEAEALLKACAGRSD